ncbi:MAG: hypothetical protein IJK44_03435 [Bacteroidales bacterium]|nr:hypothetical protein [Bacteroidales bacterium]
MRKISAYFGVIAAAALTLVSCAKEANDPNYKEEIIKEGIPFEIVANPATKTTIDGLQTQWAADDEINLLHAVAGSTTYVDDGKFTTESAGTSVTFTGTLASELASGTYDWYAVYPYNSYLHTVDNNPASPARFYIGKRSDQAQEQTGNSSTAHLCGTNYPLFGKAAGVAYDETPSVTLSPIASFIEIKVTNKTDDPLTVTSVSFTAPEGSEIVGQYEIHFDTTPLTITKYSTYVSDVANLTVTDGTPIAKDAYATFYIGVKPFSTTSGDDIKVAVNGYEKTIHTTKDFAFQAGKMKTVNFDYDAAPDPYSWVKTPIGSLVAGDVIVIVDEASSTALTSANGSSSAPTASSVSISSNKLSATPAEALQFVLEIPEANNYSFKAVNTTNYLYTTTSNNGVRVGTNANKVFVWEGGYLKNVATSRYVGVYNDQDWRCYTSTTGNIASTQTAFYKKMLITPAVEYNITIAPASHGTVSTSPASKAEEGALVTITATPDDGYILSSLTVVDASSANVAVSENQFSMPAKDVTVTATFALQPSINKLKDSIDDVPAAGVSGEVEIGVYSLTNAVDGDVVIDVDGTVVTDAIVDGGTVMYDVAENTGAARSGWIKLSVPGGNLIQIDVNQLGSATPTYTVTYTQAYSGTGHTVATTGTAPAGSACSWTTTYTNSNQLTSGKSMTYTITGFDGKTITGLTLHLRTNASKGTGSVSMMHGSTEFGSYSVPVLGSTYSDQEATVTATTIGTGETVTVVITAAANSVYCEYITLSYK